MECCDNYLPIPPRVWSRVQNSCSLNTDTGDSFIKLPYSGKLVPSSSFQLEMDMLSKGNVLQYKKNSSNITQKQRYAQIAKGQWVNRNTTWATQSSRGYTNPNTQSLKRVGAINITLSGVPTTLPVTCPTITPVINNVLPSNSGGSVNPPVPPPPPPPPVDSGTSIPLVADPVVPDPVVIQDEGVLICNVQQNICTGEEKAQPANIPCFLTSDSDVPGPIRELCWNDGTPTWYPRQRYVMTNSTDKWPVNYKFLRAARCRPIIKPIIPTPTPPIVIEKFAPVLDYVLTTETDADLGWTMKSTANVISYTITYEPVLDTPTLNYVLTSDTNADLGWTMKSTDNVVSYTITYEPVLDTPTLNYVLTSNTNADLVWSMNSTDNVVSYTITYEPELNNLEPTLNYVIPYDTNADLGWSMDSTDNVVSYTITYEPTSDVPFLVSVSTTETDADVVWSIDSTANIKGYYVYYEPTSDVPFLVSVSTTETDADVVWSIDSTANVKGYYVYYEPTLDVPV
jgi:hypothetical protein